MGKIVVVVGILLVVAGGLWWWKNQTPVEVEILGASETQDETKIQVDVQGEVVNSGVYMLEADARIKDAIAAAGGLSANADRIWVARYINLAQKVMDGTKIYIPAEGKIISTTSNLININTASIGELDSLSGVGEVKAKAIVAGRPFGAIEELVSKKILPQSSFEKIKDQISVY